MTDYTMVVLSNAVEGRDDEYNEWYDGRHLDDILKLPGFVRGRRFINDNPMSPEPPKHKYLALYDIETDDLNATFQQFFAATNTDAMPISDALAPDAVPVVYRALGPTREKPVSFQN